MVRIEYTLFKGGGRDSMKKMKKSGSIRPNENGSSTFTERLGGEEEAGCGT